ncbi:MAG: hypothetical protein AAGA90_07970 [Actinomycetota bacterium]
MSYLCNEGIDVVLSSGTATATMRAYAVSAGFAGSRTSTFTDIAATAIEGSGQVLTGVTIDAGRIIAAAPVFDDVVDGDDQITQVAITIQASGGDESLLSVDTNPDLDPTGLSITYQVDPTNGLVAIATA